MLKPDLLKCNWLWRLVASCMLLSHTRFLRVKEVECCCFYVVPGMWNVELQRWSSVVLMWSDKLETWEIHPFSFLIFISPIYTLISFQYLVTMHDKWQAFSEEHMFVNNSFQRLNLSRVDLEINRTVKDWKAASKFLIYVPLSFKIKLWAKGIALIFFTAL
jgi:hypothetical protein